MSSKEGPFQLGPELETKRIWGSQIDQEKGSKRRKITHPRRLRLLLLLGSICSSFGLWEAFLVAGNEVVVVELGGVEEMVIRDLGIFKEMRGIEMELCMVAWRTIFQTLECDIACLLEHLQPILHIFKNEGWSPPNHPSNSSPRLNPKLHCYSSQNFKKTLTS